MPETFDTGYELLPRDDAELTGDEALDAAFGEREDALVEDGGPTPLGRGWAFDFESGQFMRHGYAPMVVSDEEHLRVWIEKTLRTSRFSHSIYSDNYGTEIPEDLIGQPFSSEMAGLVVRAVEDALLVHDRITQVKDFHFTGGIEDDLLEIAFTVVLDDEELTIDSVPIARSGL